MIRFLSCLAAATAMLAACATLEPEPCTPEWVEWRTDRVLNDFARRNRSDISELRSAASYLDGQSTFGAMKMAFAVESARRLANDFADTAVPELRGFARQCGTTTRMSDFFIAMLEDQNLDPEVMRWARGAAMMIPDDVDTLS